MSPETLVRMPLVALATVSLSLSPVPAGTISLAWDPLPEQGVAGYRVFYGTSSGSYTHQVDVGRATEFKVDGLADCTTWFLAVKAYDGAGNESQEFSQEIVGWPRPALTGVIPGSARQGSLLTLDIFGTNFAPGAKAEIANPGILQGGSAVLSCNQIQSSVSIEPTAQGVRPAQIGNVAISVVDPDGVFGEMSEAFTVEINPERFDIERGQGTTDGRIDGWDVVSLSRRFASQEGGPLYDPDVDFNGDGWVDGQDLSHLASNMGRCWDGAAWTVPACPQPQE